MKRDITDLSQIELLRYLKHQIDCAVDGIKGYKVPEKATYQDGVAQGVKIAQWVINADLIVLGGKAYEFNDSMR